MTSLVALFGLLPAALSHGIGSETQKPLAVVVIGGAVVLAVVARLVQTPILVLVHWALERRAKRRAAEAEADPLRLG
jgi:cobalt-zinc-cadmium resistance protein CzcA